MKEYVANFVWRKDAEKEKGKRNLPTKPSPISKKSDSYSENSVRYRLWLSKVCVLMLLNRAQCYAWKPDSSRRRRKNPLRRITFKSEKTPQNYTALL